MRALVGRDHELAELDGALDRLAAGEPWFVQIVGEPGIGKSRLLAELCRRGEDRGYLVLEGRAAEFERDIPFGLIVDALNDYLGVAGTGDAPRPRRRPALGAGRDLPVAAAAGGQRRSPPRRGRRALQAALRDQKRA